MDTDFIVCTSSAIFTIGVAVFIWGLVLINWWTDRKWRR